MHEGVGGREGPITRNTADGTEWHTAYAFLNFWVWTHGYSPIARLVGAVDSKFVPCRIVSKFTSNSRNFVKLNTVIICLQHSKQYTHRLNATAWWCVPPKMVVGPFLVTTTARGRTIFRPSSLEVLLTTAWRELDIGHAHGMKYFMLRLRGNPTG